MVNFSKFCMLAYHMQIPISYGSLISPFLKELLSFLANNISSSYMCTHKNPLKVLKVIYNVYF